MSRFNQVVFQFLHALAGRNGFLDGIGIFLAEYLPYLLVLGFLVFILRQHGTGHKFYLFAEATLAVILARGIITEIIRFFYYHPRPFDWYGFTPLIGESGSSFPSGHTAWFFAFAMVAWYVNRRWGVWYFILASLVSLARIYVGVHWPLDIIGGVIVGIGSAMLIHRILKKFREAIKNAPRGSRHSAEAHARN